MIKTKKKKQNEKKKKGIKQTMMIYPWNKANVCSTDLIRV